MKLREIIQRARLALENGIEVREVERGLRHLGASKNEAKMAIHEAKRQMERHVT
jgi:hypothetical protein